MRSLALEKARDAEQVQPAPDHKLVWHMTGNRGEAGQGPHRWAGALLCGCRESAASAPPDETRSISAPPCASTMVGSIGEPTFKHRRRISLPDRRGCGRYWESTVNGPAEFERALPTASSVACEIRRSSSNEGCCSGGEGGAPDRFRLGSGFRAGSGREIHPASTTVNHRCRRSQNAGINLASCPEGQYFRFPLVPVSAIEISRQSSFFCFRDIDMVMLLMAKISQAARGSKFLADFRGDREVIVFRALSEIRLPPGAWRGGRMSVHPNP